MKIEIGDIEIKGKITIDDLEIGVKKVFPNMEDLEITPSIEEQNFSGSYGNVKVNAIEGENLDIIPTDNEQSFDGIYTKVNVGAIQSEELNIVPSATEQVNEGLYNKVTVAGDSNLSPENIIKGKSIFGVDGTAQATDLEITNGAYLFHNGNRLNTLTTLLTLCGKLTSMENMFYTCRNLTDEFVSNINALDTSEVTNMKSVFYACSNLTNVQLTNFNTSKVTNMNGMFHNCTKTVNMDLSSFDMSKVVDARNIFMSCNALTNLKSFKNLGKGYTQKSNNYYTYVLDLSYCKNLTHESLMDVITNGLYDLNLTYNVANGGTLYTQSLNLGSENLAKLTAEEIAIATNKGWNVS